MAEVLVLAGPGKTRATCALLTLARRIGTPAVALGGPPDAKTAAALGRFGATTIYSVTAPEMDRHPVAARVELLVHLAHRDPPAAILVASGRDGLEIAGRVAVRLDSGFLSDVIDVTAGPDGPVATQSVQGGAYLVESRVVRGIPILAVRTEQVTVVPAPSTPTADRAAPATPTVDPPTTPAVNRVTPATPPVDPPATPAVNRVTPATPPVDPPATPAVNRVTPATPPVDMPTTPPAPPATPAVNRALAATPVVDRVRMTFPESVRAVRLIARGPTRPRDLSTAAVIVAGGRGVGSPEGFGLVRRLAAALDGVAAGSHAAAEQGWCPREMRVDQVGTIVHPSLYLALGISGSLRHRTGMHGAGTIVAVDSDPDAPIFRLSDLGAVGDVHQVVPELLAEIERRRAHPVIGVDENEVTDEEE